MLMNHPKDSILNSPNKQQSLGDLILEYAYHSLFSSEFIKKTGRGAFLRRRDARLILANNIRIDKIASEIILSELERRNLLENRNHGIYMKPVGG